jgi:hypothetical protein
MDEKPDNSSYRAFLFLKISQPSSLDRRLFLKTKKEDAQQIQLFIFKMTRWDS